LVAALKASVLGPAFAAAGFGEAGSAFAGDFWGGFGAAGSAFA
jgi:hypothetical protein